MAIRSGPWHKNKPAPPGFPVLINIELNPFSESSALPKWREIVSTLTVPEAVALRSQSGMAAEYQWIDVRSASEFATGHVPRAVNIPMDQIEARLDDLPPNRPILLVCQAGKRARMVAGLIEPCRSDVTVLEGGTAAWKKAGLPLVMSAESRWSIERQVRLAAGLLIVIALVLSLTVSRYWLGLVAFVGVGLTFAGATDLCLMASLLVGMPWNRVGCVHVRSVNQQARCNRGHRRLYGDLG